MRELASEIAEAIRGSFPKEVEFAASMFPKRYPNGVEEESESEVPDIETASSDLSLSSATI